MATSRRTGTKASEKARTKGAAAASPIDPRFAPVAAAFADDRAVGLGKMFSSSSVLNVNGKIFAMLARDRFVAKLPRARVDALVAAGAGEPFDPGHGRPMKEWIALEGSRTTWVALAREARAFVGGLDEKAGAKPLKTKPLETKPGAKKAGAKAKAR